MRTTLAPFAIIAIVATAVMSGCSLLGIQTADDLAFTAGECIVAANSDPETGMPEIVECSDAHDGEIYHTEDLTSDDFPADAATLANDICADQYEGFVGASLEETEYVFSFYAPSVDTWGIGDRQVACVIESPTGEDLTQSLQGAEA